VPTSRLFIMLVSDCRKAAYFGGHQSNRPLHKLAILELHYSRSSAGAFFVCFFCYIVPYRREKTNKCILCEATSQHVVKPCTPFFSQTAVFPLLSLNDTPVLISKFVSRSLGFLGSSQDAYVIIHMNVLYLSHMWSFTVAASCFPKIFADLSSLQLSHPLMLAIKPNTTN